MHLTSNNPERKSEAKAKSKSNMGSDEGGINLKSEIPCWYKNNGYTTHDVSFQ
ncbi:hypothetical protein [Staphylococcus xylosus]|uniref:hypothetical protein n=1 Tax=Staphylococcus xylosus TaxID=1288 RepID=UPI00398BAD82